MSLPDLITDNGSPQSTPSPPTPVHPLPLEDITRTNGDSPKGFQPKFEAFVMTGDRILKLCQSQQGMFKPRHQKKMIYTKSSTSCSSNYQKNNSVPTSPVETERYKGTPSGSSSPPLTITPITTASTSYIVRTSKSEDHLQFNKDALSAVTIDIDDDVTSSLNTLLDTKQDCSDIEDQRIVWTYNAPFLDSSNSSNSENRSMSPASPTSVSSSVMSSNSSNSSDSADKPLLIQETKLNCNTNLDLSQSEGISNISSPDFQEEDSEIITRDLVMEVSDPSDSDSTLLVSESNKSRQNGIPIKDIQGEHRIVIQVKGPDKYSNGKNRSNSSQIQQNRLSRGSVKEEELYSTNLQNVGYKTLNDVEDESLEKLSESAANLAKSVSPPLTEDESDIESLHSFHYSPKAVDVPSAIRLAKRLFTLDGFKKTDVSRHLSKNNEFSRAVAEEYLKYFDFTADSLDVALRTFLTQFCLTGETQERERVLVHFSKRYMECNPGIFGSQDAVHTLTCAIMLLNTDLHGQVIGRKMTCVEFISNLAELNEGGNFPRDILKALYHSIKNHPLEWALDNDTEENDLTKFVNDSDTSGPVVTAKGVFDNTSPTSAIEYKKGYVMRKCCIEPNGKKTPLGKRGWKMFYCTLRDLHLYLHKDEHGFRKTQISDSFHNGIRIHHALATKASDYTKKLHVFRLETADQAVYLFQTSDSKELQSWIDTINFVCASFSAQPLPGAVGSQKKFQRPLLPSSHSKLSLRDQLHDHELMIQKLEVELENHRKYLPERNAKQLILYNYREKDVYLQYELKKYKTYAFMLRSRMAQLPDMVETTLIESIGESAEEISNDDKQKSPNSRYNNNRISSRETY